MGGRNKSLRRLLGRPMILSLSAPRVLRYSQTCVSLTTPGMEGETLDRTGAGPALLEATDGCPATRRFACDRVQYCILQTSRSVRSLMSPNFRSIKKNASGLASGTIVVQELHPLVVQFILISNTRYLLARR